MRNIAVLAECSTHEVATERERILRNALKFGTSREVDSKEGLARAEGLEHAPPNSSEALEFQVKLNGTVGEAIILKPPLQCL